MKEPETRAPAPSPTPLGRVAQALARLFHVSEDEVALLRIEGDSLAFVLPERLRGAGNIPLTAASASIAARTATTGRPELHNRCSTVRHASVFEGLVKGDRPIQKLMSVPVALGGRTVAVVQVSRKGGPGEPVPDFTGDDLNTLAHAVADLADVFS